MRRGGEEGRPAVEGSKEQREERTTDGRESVSSLHCKGEGSRLEAKLAVASKRGPGGEMAEKRS